MANTLLKLVTKNPQHYFRMGMMLVAMCFLTLSSQMEVISLGILAQKGPNFFELFAPLENGSLNNTGTVTKEALNKRFDEIDEKNRGKVTQDDAIHFLSKTAPKGLLERVLQMIESFAPISGNVFYLAVMISIVATLKAVSLFWHRFSIKLLTTKVSRNLRQEYFEHIQTLPMSFYQKYNIGSLSSRIVSDANLIAQATNAMLINYIETPIAVISSLILCFLSSWKLSLVIFLGFPFIFFPIAYLGYKVKSISKQMQKNQENFASVLIDFLSGIQTVKVFGMEDFSLKKYREENNKMAFLEKRGAKYDVSSRPIVHTIAMTLLSSTLICGLYLFDMHVAEVFVYGGLLYLLYEPLKSFAETNAVVQRGAAAADRMMEVLSIQPHIKDSHQAIQIPNFQEKIEFKDVWFRYDQEWVLKGLNFTIEKGQMVAIVGPTGAGKSTIIQLLPRLWEPEKGEILVDGKPINAYTQKSLRNLFAFVPQKPFLFMDTVANNISFGRPYSDQQIMDALTQAHAIEFVTDLPQKHQSFLSEGGKNLSGGQQQRLAIARALFKNASILVMDEATSSLDAVSENKIKCAIQSLQGVKTQIIIAHRLSTIEDADKIIYIEKGVKIQEGTKEELLKNCAGFRAMWEMMKLKET